MQERSFANEQEIVVGTFVSGGITGLEILAWTGFDLVCIESEHAARDLVEIVHMIRAADATGVPSIVRVQDLSEVGRVLDAGADGVIVPHIDDRDQALQAVDAFYHPPKGNRGAGPGRAIRYGLGKPDVADPLLIVMIESVAAVANIADIVTVADIDIFFVGPNDLATSMGVPAGSPEHTAAITTVMEACAAAGRRAGVFVRDAEALAHWQDLGATFFLLGSDHSFLAKAARDALEQSRTAIASASDRSGGATA